MFTVRSALPITALALLVGLTGCTPTATPAPAAKNDTDATVTELGTVATPDWTVDASLVGEPVAADGVVLAYTRTDSGGLQIEAWDAETGAQLWADTAVTGAVTPGVMVSASIVEAGDTHVAAYLRPGGGDDWQELALADLATGTRIAVTDNQVWASSRPSTCADGADVCFTGYKQSAYDAGSLSYRLAATGGDITPDGDLVVPAAARLLGNRVYATNERVPAGVEMLGASAAGQTLWKRSYEDVFGAGASSDAGWAWADADATEVMVGAGYIYDPAARASDSFTSDATQRRTVGLDPQSGATVWSIDGADFCDLAVSEDDRADGKRTLCLYKAGTTTVIKKADGSGSDSTSVDFDVDLIGVDLATGDIDWTLPLGGDRFNGTNTDSSFASSSADQVMLIDGASEVVNVVTGDHSETSVDSTYACSTPREPLLALFPGMTETAPFTAGSDHSGCDSTGTGTETFSTGAVRMIGVGTGTGTGTAIVAGPGSLLGFALGDEPKG
jgi:hypothetical protein